MELWSMLGVMKATLTLDDDVAARLEQAHRRSGKSLERLGNELLRRGLELLPRTFVKPSGEAQPYRIQPFPSGRCLVANLDNVVEVLAEASSPASAVR